VVRKGRIVFVALRSIAPGDEITYDYGREYFDFFFKKGGCRCTACRAKAAADSVAFAAALCERLRRGSIAPFIPLPIEVTT
jgi:SET domain-containing protein